MTQRDLFYEEPNLADYDLILVNSSGAKDSAASLDYVAEKARACGVLSRLLVVHADLGHAEWPGTADLVAEHAAHYGARFIKVSRPQGGLISQIRARGMWPDAQNRYCTSGQKTGQVLRVMTSLVEEINLKRCIPLSAPLKKLGLRPVRFLNVMGMRAQESPARAKKSAFGPDERASNTKRRVDRWLAIHDWTEHEVWRRLASAGLREHPAYALGMSRASCSLCVLASKRDLVTAARLRPDLAEEYALLEADMDHDFRLDLPMREIVRLARKPEDPR